MANILGLPATLTVGVTYRWPAPLIQTDPTDLLAIAIAGDSLIPVSAVRDNGTWVLEIDGNDTAEVEPGLYFWSARAVDDQGRGRTLGSGSVQVVVDLANVDLPYDGRSPARRILDGLMAAMEEMAAGKISSYSIEGRSATYRSLEELQKAIDYWKRQVKNEENAQAIAQGLPSRRTAKVRFSE